MLGLVEDQHVRQPDEQVRECEDCHQVDHTPQEEQVREGLESALVLHVA